MWGAVDWYPKDVPAYRLDTRHLTTLEHGAYNLLIDEYMMTREPLPDDDRVLASIARMPVEEWSRIAPTIRAFFRPRAGMLFLKKCDAILNAQDNSSKRLSERAQKAANKRWSAIKGLDATSITQECSEDASVMLGDARERERVRKIIPDTELNSERGAPAKNSRGARLTADWGLSADLLAWTIGALREHGMDIPTAEAWKDRILPKFRDYWTGKAGAAARKTDWDATWRNWLRRELETIPRMNGNHNGPTEQAETDRRAKLVAGAVARTTRPLAGGLAPLPAGNADTFLPAFSGRNGRADA